MSAVQQIFGEPFKGVHASRFLGMAQIDLLFTAIASLIVVLVSRYSLTFQTLLRSFVTLFVIGQIFHVLFGVNTAFIARIKKYW